MANTKHNLPYRVFKFGGHFPETEDCDWEEGHEGIIEEVLGGEDEETWQGRLVADWRGMPAGSLVIGGLSVEGHPFVIIPAH